jgi:hypothetical protein
MITIGMSSVVNTDRDQESIPQDSHEWEDVKYQVGIPSFELIFTGFMLKLSVLLPN